MDAIHMTRLRFVHVDFSRQGKIQTSFIQIIYPRIKMTILPYAWYSRINIGHGCKGIIYLHRSNMRTQLHKNWLVKTSLSQMVLRYSMGRGVWDTRRKEKCRQPPSSTILSVTLYDRQVSSSVRRYLLYGSVCSAVHLSLRKSR